jgi:ribosomal protein S18 acetylase RimI-like enzyme
MTIRPAQIEDAPALARVMVDTFLAAHRGQIPEAAWEKRRQEWTYAVSERSWARYLGEMAAGESPGEYLYVGEDETGTVVGLASGHPARDAGERVGTIGGLYVLPSHQGRGLGRRLAQAVAARLARDGMSALQIGCLAANAPARSFYEALGGVVVAEREVDEGGFMLPEVVYGWSDIEPLAGDDRESGKA